MKDENSERRLWGLLFRWLIFIGGCLVKNQVSGQRWGKLKNETSRELNYIYPSKEGFPDDDERSNAG